MGLISWVRHWVWVLLVSSSVRRCCGLRYNKTIEWLWCVPHQSPALERMARDIP